MAAQHDPVEPDAPPSAIPEGTAPEPSDETEFAAVLLGALAAMALRNRNRQADLLPALHGAGIGVDRPRVQAALRLLYAKGCVMNLVPLADGGLLLRVTGVPLAEPEPNEWLPPDQLEAEVFATAKLR